jgi:esterase/lipase
MSLIQWQARAAEVAMLIAERTQKDILKVASTTPVLVIHSQKDLITDYRAAREVIEKIEAPIRFVSLERSNHLILWDYESELVEREILQFLKQTK